MPRTKKTDLELLLDALPVLAEHGVSRIQVGDIIVNFTSIINGDAAIIPSRHVDYVQQPVARAESTQFWDSSAHDTATLTDISDTDTIISGNDTTPPLAGEDGLDDLDLAHVDD